LISSYLLIADALRRLYMNFKANTDFIINKKLLFTYLAATAAYSVFLIVSFCYIITLKRIDSEQFMIGQSLSTYAN